MSIRKIVVIGPESTGKSTLSKAVANALHTEWVPEYARQYLEALSRPYEEHDLKHIAKAQIRQEDICSERCGGFLICDTDLYVVKVWSEHRYNRCDRWILEQIALRRYDLYLLTDIDIAWKNDPLREHPEEQMRRYFYNQYKDIVMHSGIPWAGISGMPEKRISDAMNVIRKLFP